MKPKSIAWIIAGIIALSVGLYFRLYPLLKHTPESASQKATLLVLSRLKSQITDQIESTHPQLSQHQKDLLIKKSLNDLIHKDNANVKTAIEKLGRSLSDKEKKSDRRHYLLASDSFYYYGLTENILHTGQLGPKVKGSKYLNHLMLAPKGHWEPFTLHPYIGYLLYRFLKLFYPGMDLMFAVSFTPLLITSVSLIAFIIICYYLKCRPIVSLSASIYFLLSPVFIRRSTFGWYDNDPYNVLFPLLLLLVFCIGLKTNQKPKSQLLWIILSILLMSLYSLFWQGWVFFFAITCVTALISVLISLAVIRDKTALKPLAIFFGSIIAGSFLLIALIFGPQDFFVLFKEGWTALKNFLTPQLSLWPDLFISVGELHRSTLPEIIQQLGGTFFFTIAVIGFIFTLIFSLKHPKENNHFFIALLTLYALAAFFISLGAQRFAILSVVPFSLYFAFGLETVFQRISRVLERSRISLKPAIKKAFVFGLSFLILAISYFPTISIYKSIPTLLNPIYDDTWDSVMTQIHAKTHPSSIITAWWPPGHFIKSIAKRRVSFDGATINFPQAYWVSNFFLSQNEEEALGILRMLNTSANDAADYLQSLGFKLSTSVQIIKTITSMGEFEAKMILTSYLKDENKVNHFLKLTKGSPPPSYCLLYNEFVEKNLQLPFIGNWNFKQIEEINADPEKLKKIPPANSPEYIQFLWKLAGGSYKYSGKLAQISRIDQALIFEENLRVDLNRKTAQIASEKYGKGIPFSLFYVEDNEIKENKLPESNLPFSVILYSNGPLYSTILMDRRLAQSMLIRLFYFEGKGLKYFKPFIQKTNLTRRNEIQVYEIDWKEFMKERQKPAF